MIKRLIRKIAIISDYFNPFIVIINKEYLCLEELKK